MEEGYSAYLRCEFFSALSALLEFNSFLESHMRLRLFTLASVILLAAALPLAAHVGSSDVFYEGNAGRYRLFVTVRVPQVIPGIAEIQVRSESNDVSQISVVVLTLTGPGSSLPPTADLA